MSMFAVIFHDAAPEMIDRLKAAYPHPDHLEVQPDTYLISGDLLIEDITKVLGMTPDGDGAGLVIRCNGTYSGRTYRRNWDWLARATEITV